MPTNHFSCQAQAVGALCSVSCVQDVALALEAHEPLVRDTFGPEAQLELLGGLQVGL